MGELVRLGAQVHTLALPDAALDQLRGDDNVIAHGVDVRDAATVAAILHDVEVDVLVNNAGIIGDLRAAHESTAATADALIDINFRAAVHTTMLVLPGMVGRGRGHIVFTGSIAASRPTANTAVYSATKAALQAFADGLRMDLHGSAVRITVLAPGRVETNLYDAALGGHDEAAARLYTELDIPATGGCRGRRWIGVDGAVPRRCDPDRGRADLAGVRWQRHRWNRVAFHIVGWFRDVESARVN